MILKVNISPLDFLKKEAIIYSPQEPDEDDDNYDEDYEESQQQLDGIYYDANVLAGNKLSELGFDVGETFSGYS